MSKDVFIFEVTAANFQATVLANSSKIPVVVEFMGVWSEHCMVVDNIFSSLAREHASEFIFAKVDIDEQPDLRKQFGIENIPSVIVFKDGDLVRAEMGELTETDARGLLRDLGISHPSDDLREEARAKHIAGDTPAAIMLLSQAMQMKPVNVRVAMDMVQIFIDIGDVANAQGLFNKLPEASVESATGKSLNDQLFFAKAAAQTAGFEAVQQIVLDQPDDSQAKFDLAMCWMAQHEPRFALDQLLAIVTSEPAFRDGAAREMAVTILRMHKETLPELAQEYQRKLNNLLAS